MFFQTTQRLASGVTLLCLLTMSGCIRPEAPNAEADILSVSLGETKLLRPSVVTNNTVTLYLPGITDASALAPTFELTPGAKISPASGEARDFTQAQTYVVTSEDGKWTKEYRVAVVQKQPLRFSFENVRLQGDKFHVFYEKGDGDDPLMEWASGNIGFALANPNAKATDYPTFQTDEGYKGKGACLVTRDTGDLGLMFGSPIAGGSLYIGSIDLNSLIAKPLEATKFGAPLTIEPAYLCGYYRYTPGKVVTDKTRKVVEGATDTFDIYAVVFDTTMGKEYLNGTNSLTDPSLVLTARVTEKVGDGAWHRFVIPFTAQEGKTLDPEKLKNGDYSYSIVLASSINAANFEGAVGSTLVVDELELFEKEEETK